jgi:hypothetical protein
MDGGSLARPIASFQAQAVALVDNIAEFIEYLERSFRERHVHQLNDVPALLRGAL